MNVYVLMKNHPGWSENLGVYPSLEMAQSKASDFPFYKLFDNVWVSDSHRIEQFVMAPESEDKT